MGKRKKAAKKPQGPKRNEPLAKVFACLFCNHEKSVEVDMDRKTSTGTLLCKVCGQSYQSQINYLSAAVDVYSDWVDACDAVAKANNEEGASGTTYTQRPGIQGTGGRGEADRDTYNDHDHEGYEGEGIVADDEYD